MYKLKTSSRLYISGLIFLTLLLLPLVVFPQTVALQQVTSSKSLSVFSTNQPKEGKTIWVARNPFNRRLFLENVGQFNGKTNISGSKIKFAVCDKETWIYFTPNGLTYRHDRRPELTEEDMDKAEFAKNEKDKQAAIQSMQRVITTYVNMQWLGSNPDVQIETMGEAPDHFSYPPDIIEGNKSLETFIAKGFEKITYKNLYKGIDVEYTMMPFEKGGFKYTIILHPGADPSVIKMLYSDVKKLKLDKEGNIIIRSKMGDILDHAPLTFYKDGSVINSQFILTDNIVSFQLGAYDHSKTIVIDPWTTTTGAANTNAYDVDFDDLGNVYTYGGPANYQVVKFNSAGVQQWVFNANFNGTGSYGDFAVDQKSQSIYIGESVNLTTGAQVRKIRGTGASASQLAVFAGDTKFNEIWRMQYNPCIGKTVMGGASTSAPNYFQAAMLDTNVTTLTPVNMFGASEPYHDIGLLAVDDYGATYMLTARSVFGNATILDNSMAKAPVPALSPTTWQISSGLTLVEYTANTYVTESTSAYNGMAVSPNYLYTYDGMTLTQWNMSTGAKIKTQVVGGATAPNYNYGGITVDRCDNIYVGFNKTIYRFDVNLVNQATVATCAGNVFDLKIGKNDILYACGASFVQALSATPCINNVMTLAMSSTGSCAGTSSATVAVSGGTPPYTYSWSTSPVQTTATASNLSAGTYTVTVTDGSCYKAIATNTITVTSGPGVPVTVTPTTSTICQGASTTLTASGANSYSWSPTTGLNTSIGASVVASPTVTTTYTVTGTTTGCSGTAVTTVNVDPLPTVTVNSPDVCTGQSAVLTASGSSTYSWSPGTSLSATTGTSVTTTTTVAINYVVTGTSAAGCVNTAQSSVTISTMPSSNAGADITICSGATGNIGAPATAGYVYIWSPTTGLSSSTAPDPTITLTSATQSTFSYTVTTSPAGCSSTDVVNVTVKVKDDATFSYPSPTACQTGGTDPVATISGTPGGVFTFTPAGLNINASTGLITLASSTLGTYTVTYTTTGLCPDTSDYAISIVTVPVATFSYAGPYCQGFTPNALPIMAAGASKGVFTVNPAGLVFVSTATGEVNLTTSPPNTYTVTNTIAASGGCPSAIDTHPITINAVPVTTVTSTVVCSGVSTTLTAGGATTYLWSDGSTLATLTSGPLNTTSYTVTGTTAGCSSSAVGTITTNPIPTVTVNNVTVCAGTPATLTASGATSYSWSNGSASNAITVSPGTTTPYTVTGTTAGCSSSAIGTITVNPIPTVTVNSPVICIGLSATLSASGATTYLWSNASTANPLFVTPVTTTPYTVTGTTAGCSASAVSTVTVTQLPVITVNSTTICSGQSSTLTASGGATYVWSTGASGNTITVSPITTTPYTVSDNTAGCSGSATATVTVNPTPVVTVNSAIICAGQLATLTASGANTYVWSNGSVTSTLTDSPSATMPYTVTGTSLNCSTSASASITVLPLPIITATGTSICSGSTAKIYANGGTSYVWSSGSVTDSATVSPLTDANYTVTGTGGGCTSNAVATVKVFPIPTAAFSGTPNPVGVLEPVITFTDRSSSDVNYWFWDFGDGDSVIGTQNPIHQFPPMEATYTVTLTVQNAGLCPNSISKTVVVGPDFTFYIPNAFSPNDDQKNDVFGASGGGIKNFKLMIFDRWGNQIFSTDDITKTWDGKANGGAEIAQQDVFVWKVKITDVFKKEHEFIGTVTIVK